ncbi:MAG: DUF4142 domain-containing protein, partial [Gemmatimonadota bacterium]|nr:DUF4142 domain-containing protein [Gemmatimonadota bacterium]
MAQQGPIRTIPLVIASAAVLSAGCSDRGGGAGDTGIAMNVDSTATGMPAGTGNVGPASALSDANIVYLLDAANRVDSAAGSIAATKGTNSEVREFGTRMARDHHTLRKQGQDLAAKLGVAPEPPAGDTAQAHFDKTIAMLNGVAKGREFDKAYIDHEVAYHKALLETATNAMAAAQNAELKNLIQ